MSFPNSSNHAVGCSCYQCKTSSNNNTYNTSCSNSNNNNNNTNNNNPFQGPQGPPGPMGYRGIAGRKGVAGPMGPKGFQGAVGSPGANGAAGPAGAPGAQGPAGLPGAPGQPGTAGNPGATGATGAQGQRGTTGTISNQIYVYNIIPQTVPVESPVLFSNNGTTTSAGFTHTINSSTITVANAGQYVAWFTVSGSEVNQFSLFRNGAPIIGSTYGSGDTFQQNDGRVIFNASAGDVITLVNHSSNTFVSLITPIGGTQPTTNASLTILQSD